MTGLFPMTSLELHPVRHVIPAGTELWRVHNVRYAPHLFNPKLADPFEFKDGSRFDGTRLDPYHCLYLGDTPTTALAESVLRSRPFELPAGRRRIPYVTVVGRRLSVLRTRCDLVLVSLIEAKDLAAVCQESTLLEDERNYVSARRWASEIRAQAPQPAAAGPGPLPRPVRRLRRPAAGRGGGRGHRPPRLRRRDRPGQPVPRTPAGRDLAAATGHRGHPLAGSVLLLDQAGEGADRRVERRPPAHRPPDRQGGDAGAAPDEASPGRTASRGAWGPP